MYVKSSGSARNAKRSIPPGPNKQNPDPLPCQNKAGWNRPNAVELRTPQRNKTKQSKAKQEKTDQTYMAESPSLVSWINPTPGENMNISQMQTERKMHNAGTILA